MSSFSESNAQDEHGQADTQTSLAADNATTDSAPHRSVSPVLPLPEIPSNLNLDLSHIIGPPSAEVEKVQKRASNVLKLSQENEKLKAELKAMTDRLEAAERRREELARKQQKTMESMEAPS
ncbi:hypothetical protein Hypma_011543 [Hypsizygus marmoreus]|uniref:Uncharacterized protein n=1 Tax=Hypsizygus marmoreus TaxID=39966 RepID=A0A369JN79_HYPMA|nr:hypothetical protein Hypma_011543 [Hypsizygus marmoreus]